MILTYDIIKKILQSKKYNFFEGELNLNMVGIRTNNRKIDNWDDYFCLVYQENGQDKIFIDDQFTTDPGITYMQKKLLNPKGCSILVPGQYKGMWTIGLHQNKYEAFVQKNPCSVYRDRNLNNYLDFDPTTIDTGIFGINQHHGYDSKNVGPNSAGCQVHKSIKTLKQILDIAKKSVPLHGPTFTYTLLEESDIRIC